MKNFAEEISYLFFRLNGFFLLDNYVTHAGENNSKMHTDSDLLGIRTPYVKEEIGLNNQNDFHQNLFNLIGNYSYVGLICETKGGDNNNWSLSTSRILPCIKRIGLLSEYEIEKASLDLSTNSSYVSIDEKVKIIKIIATNFPNLIEISNKWHQITLDSMLDFIEERVTKYPVKTRGWNFYSSNLFQYLLKKRQS